MEELISVIVPIYNVKPYLRQCLDSICKQTYRNLEILLVDDGSTDGCSEICDEYALNDKRIKVIHKANEGLVRARKMGLLNASGQLIGYVDGDDWIELDMFEKLYSALVSENVDISMCGRIEETEGTHRCIQQGLQPGSYNKKQMLEIIYPNMIVNENFFEWGIYPNFWDKLFRRKCMEEFQMKVNDNLRMGEDAACVYPSMLKADSICILAESLYHYRQRSDSMVKAVGKTEKKSFHTLYNSVKDVLVSLKDTYDLEEQWRDFLLFIMVPRADGLYSGFSDKEFLFPFPDVKKGSDIILYGMGIYGQRLYNFLQKTNFCNVVACVDINYTAVNKQGFPAVGIDEIEKINCKDIVVANSFYHTRSSILQNLKERFPDRNIHVMDEALIKSKETLAAFGID
jgi:glycosyltransferase involved in cell wall biosynthesis